MHEQFEEKEVPKAVGTRSRKKRKSNRILGFPPDPQKKIGFPGKRLCVSGKDAKQRAKAGDGY